MKLLVIGIGNEPHNVNDARPTPYGQCQLVCSTKCGLDKKADQLPAPRRYRVTP